MEREDWGLKKLKKNNLKLKPGATSIFTKPKTISI